MIGFTVLSLISSFLCWFNGNNCRTNITSQSIPRGILNQSPTRHLWFDSEDHCFLLPNVHLFAETSPAPFTPALPSEQQPSMIPLPGAPRTIYRQPEPLVVFSKDGTINAASKVKFLEAYGLQNQPTYCKTTGDSPKLSDVVKLWGKIVEVGVEWCCTSGMGCDVIAEYQSAEIQLCARRELCVRCLNISFGIGRLMRSCEMDSRVEGSLGTRENIARDGIPVIRVLPRSKFYLGGL